MAKLRHIALIVEDPDATAAFFEAAFGMTRCGDAWYGCHMSDGVVSVALLRKETDEEVVGIHHFGALVDDLGAASEQVVAAGATPLGENKPGNAAFYEAKFTSPDGIVFDLSQTGWPGMNIAPQDG